RRQVLLRLFAAVFKTVTVHPENETVVRPHLVNVVLSCLRYTTRVTDPAGYYEVLRQLFRALGGGKFVESYRELAPLLPLMLGEFSKLHARADDPVAKGTLAELCLMVPARLSALIPHLTRMMPFMAYALRSQHGQHRELALRTLEFWVENLEHGQLYNTMAKASL
ncbi:unnamed protein product, partial [Phaeothamnion confervicola]